MSSPYQRIFCFPIPVGKKKWKKVNTGSEDSSQSSNLVSKNLRRVFDRAQRNECVVKDMTGNFSRVRCKNRQFRLMTFHLPFFQIMCLLSYVYSLLFICLSTCFCVCVLVIYLKRSCCSWDSICHRCWIGRTAAWDGRERHNHSNGHSSRRNDPYALQSLQPRSANGTI